LDSNCYFNCPSKNFILSNFYSYYHEISQNYLNILGPSYNIEDPTIKKTIKKARVNVIFEEKDKRSYISREHTKMNQL